MAQKSEHSAPARSAKRSSHSAKRSPEELRSWEQVNQRLASLGEAERQIRSLRDQFEQKVAVLKQQWLEGSHPVLRDKEKIECQIERFFWAHRDEVLACGRKSVDLVFGRLGSRHSRSVVVRDAAAAMEWLRDNGFMLVAGPPRSMSLLEIRDISDSVQVLVESARGTIGLEPTPRLPPALQRSARDRFLLGFGT